MKVFRSLPLAVKLLIPVVIPFLGLLYFAEERVERSFEDKARAKYTGLHFQKLERMGDLVHELQRERGLLYGFAIRTQGDPNQLFDQIQSSDMQIHSLRSFLISNTFSEDILDAIGGIFSVRQAAVMGSASLDQVRKTYDQVILNLLNDMEGTLVVTSDLNTGYDNFRGYVGLLRLKDSFGKLRREVYAMLLHPEASNDHFVMANYRYEEIRNNLASLAGFTGWVNKWLGESSQAQSYRDLMNSFDQILANREAEPGITASDWWMASSALIKDMRNMELSTISRLRASAELYLAATQRQLRSEIAGMVILFILSLFLFYGFFRPIRNSVSNLSHAALSIANGEDVIELKKFSRDELGLLARAFNNVIRNSNHIIEVAKKIGQGDYSSGFELRGKEDKLGAALNNMRENLQLQDEEAKNRRKIATGLNQFNDSILGIKDKVIIAREALNIVAEYSGAKVGAFYLAGEDSLFHPVATYALDLPVDTMKAVVEGEGLVGQVVADRRLKVLTDVPNDYFRVSSGLGECAPDAILIAPLSFKGNVPAVIELGFKGPSEIQIAQDFISQISDNLLANIHAAIQDELREVSFKELDNFFSISLDLMCIADTKGFFKKISGSWTEVLGYSEEELLSVPFADFVHQDDLENTLKEVEKLAGGAKTIAFENRYRKKDGDYIWLSWVASPDAETGLLYASARNVTEEKRQREKLEELSAEISRQKDLLEAVINNTTSLIFIKNLEGRYLMVNDQFKKLFGQRHCEGKTDFEIFPKDVAQSIRDFDEKVVAENQLVKHEVEVPHKDKMRTYLSANFPLHRPSGEIYAICAIATDITQIRDQREALQKQADELSASQAELQSQNQKLLASEEELRAQQEELSELNQELEENTQLLEEKNQQINEKNTNLEKAAMELARKAEELETAGRYKSEFLSNMSHELRTPLNSILLLSKLLSNNADQSLSNEQVESASVIYNSGKSLLELINEVLDLSKIEAGKMVLSLEEVSLTRLSENLKAMFKPLADEKRVNLKVILGKGLPRSIVTDDMRLQQVLKNLLSNALKFTKKGSVTLSIRPSKVELADPGRTIEFSVIDTGIGIPKEKHDLVFKAFQQADGSTQREYGGTGLGLSICREMVKLLGGRMTLSSKVSEGSNFTFYLPIDHSDEGAESDPTQLQSNGIASSAKTTTEQDIPPDVADDRQNLKKRDKVILIVEDDTSFARFVLDIARKSGFKGIVLVRGDQVMETVRKFKPYGIILDLKLPVLDGYSVLNQLKSDEKLRHIPVHVVSAGDLDKKALVNGALDISRKPITEPLVVKILEKIEEMVIKKGRKVLVIEGNEMHRKAIKEYLQYYGISCSDVGTVAAGFRQLAKREFDCLILDMMLPNRSGYDVLERIRNSPKLENLPVIVYTGKNLSKNEEKKIHKYTKSLIVKTAESYNRLMDELRLFLHMNDRNGSSKSAPSASKNGDILTGKSVLIADDDIRNIYSLTKILEEKGMTVEAASDGEEALQLAGQNDGFDVLLMDIMMPEMDGLEAIKRIRQLKAYKDKPVIAVTAKAMTSDRQKCLAAGASDYITKPVDADQLCSLLRVWLYNGQETK